MGLALAAVKKVENFFQENKGAALSIFKDRSGQRKNEFVSFLSPIF